MFARLAIGPQSNATFQIKATRLMLLAVVSCAGLTPRAQAQSVPINLGSATTFAVLAGTSVTSSGSTVLNGDLGVSSSSPVTGFGPGVVNGTVNADNALAVQAEAAAAAAYSVLTGETVTQVLTGQDLGTRTLLPGVYSFGVGAAQLTGTLILDAGNNPNARFDFLIGSTLTTATSSQITFINLAQASDVYWQVGTSATLGDGSVFAGNVVANASISLVGTGAIVDGRLLALNGTVSLIDNIVTVPTAIPEPATSALIAAVGVLGLACSRRHRIAS
jgi:hypothetical protein